MGGGGSGPAVTPLYPRMIIMEIHTTRPLLKKEGVFSWQALHVETCEFSHVKCSLLQVNVVRTISIKMDTLVFEAAHDNLVRVAYATRPRCYFLCSTQLSMEFLWLLKLNAKIILHYIYCFKTHRCCIHPANKC